MKPALRAGFAAALAAMLPITAYALRHLDPVYWTVSDHVGVTAGATVAGLLAIGFFPWSSRALRWTGVIGIAAFLTTIRLEMGLGVRGGLLMLLGALAGSRSFAHR